MPVAKSYQGLEILCEPYILDKGRQYVKVRTKSGASKQVRFYTDKEYAKMYPAGPRSTEPPTEIIRPLKEVLGFKNGYITIFKGDTYNYLEWFRRSTARFARPWGWYFISDEPMPAEYPHELEAIQLRWEQVSVDENTLMSEDKVRAVVESLIYEQKGNFVGKIGDRIEIKVNIEKSYQIDSNYGHSTFHIMKDEIGNVFTWTTNSKNWAEGTFHHIKGTLKEHKRFKGECQNVLSRCIEI